MKSKSKVLVIIQLIFLTTIFCGQLFAQEEAEKNSRFKNFSYDSGVEPEEASTAVFAFVQYSWNDNVASGIKTKFYHSVDSEDSIEGYDNANMVDKKFQLTVDVLPYIYKFSPDFKIGFGMSYYFINEKSSASMTDVNGFMFEGEDVGKAFSMKLDKDAHIFAPYIGVFGKKQLTDELTFNFSLTCNPVYLMILDQTMRYYASASVSPFNFSGSDNGTKVSSPYIESKIYLDFNKFYRISSQFTYQRLDFNQMDWSQDGNSLTGYDDTQDLTQLRLGVELLPRVDNSSRLKTGFFYEKDWFKSSYTEENSSDSKWGIIFGTEKVL